MCSLMKYRLLKDKISDLGWYWPYEKDPTVLASGGFTSAILEFGDNRGDVALLPDVVEEFVPSGMIQFEDWDEEILPPLKNDFFFKHDKRRRFNHDTRQYVTYENEHYVHISRLWVEPIE